MSFGGVPVDRDGGGKSPVNLFTSNYGHFARQNRGAEYLDLHRWDPQFAAAIAAIEADPDLFCQYHHKPRVYDGYWRHMSGGCTECEPSDAQREAVASSVG